MKHHFGNSGYTIDVPDGWKVLDVGSGHSPHPRASVCLNPDDDDMHRGYGRSIVKDGRFIVGVAEDIPFPDKHFDFVYCNHVIEHVDHPGKVIDEMVRVGKRGFFELPSYLCEVLLGDGGKTNHAHRWYSLEIEGVIHFWKIRTHMPFGSYYHEHFYKRDEIFKTLFSRKDFLYTARSWVGSKPVKWKIHRGDA